MATRLIVPEEPLRAAGPANCRRSVRQRLSEERQTLVHPVIDAAVIIGELFVTMRDADIVQPAHEPASAVQRGTPRHPDRGSGPQTGSEVGRVVAFDAGRKGHRPHSTTIKLPNEVSTDPVASLNHAFTKFSEVYELWRISRTGNLYTRTSIRKRMANGIRLTSSETRLSTRRSRKLPKLCGLISSRKRLAIDHCHKTLASSYQVIGLHSRRF